MLVSGALILAATYIFGHWLAGACLAVLMLMWRLLKVTEGPPVLALAMTTQWLQVCSGVFYTGLTGRVLPTIEDSDYQPMVLIGLGCVTALTIGLWAGRMLISRRVAAPERPVRPLATAKTLAVAYVAAILGTGAVQELAWEFPALTQAILALAFGRMALLFFILRRLTAPVLRLDLIAALLVVEVALGFTGYFSGFKEPLLLAVLATLEVFDSRKRVHWVTVGALGVLLTTVSVMWMGVRTEFRQDFESEVFASSRSARLQRMQALTGDWVRDSSGRVMDDLDRLVDRAWAIYYPALAVQRVPALLPHTDGEITSGAVIHLVTPRVLFPDKPELPSDSEMVRKYSGIFVAGAEQQTSIAFGYAAESYVDFGIPIMFLPVAVFGLLMGMAYEGLFRTIRHRDLAIALVTVIFWLGLYLFERSWIKTLGLSLTLMVYLGGATFLLDRWLLLRGEDKNLPEPASPQGRLYGGVNR